MIHENMYESTHISDVISKFEISQKTVLFCCLEDNIAVEG